VPAPERRSSSPLYRGRGWWKKVARKHAKETSGKEKGAARNRLVRRGRKRTLPFFERGRKKKKKNGRQTVFRGIEFGGGGGKNELVNREGRKGEKTTLSDGGKGEKKKKRTITIRMHVLGWSRRGTWRPHARPTHGEKGKKGNLLISFSQRKGGKKKKVPPGRQDQQGEGS